MECIEVKWTDSKYIGGWVSKEEASEFTCREEIASVGYVVRENEDEIVLASAYSKDNYMALTAIPRENIIGTKKLLTEEMF